VAETNASSRCDTLAPSSEIALAARSRSGQGVELDLEDLAMRVSNAKHGIALVFPRESRRLRDLPGGAASCNGSPDHLGADGRARDLTALTNSIGVAQAVAGQTSIDHLLLGGRVRHASGCTAGRLI
jgi:hypothetical protein